jgi:hypothetical protein
MNRSLKSERLYPLGNYTNIKFVDEINNLPEGATFNEEILNKIRYLQMIDFELAYRTYIRLYEKVQTLKIEEAVKLLEEEKTQTLQEIDKIFNTKEKES